MADKILFGSSDRGTLYACVSPSAHHVEGSVEDWKLSAILHPFRSEADALAALADAGGRDVREWRK